MKLAMIEEFTGLKPKMHSFSVDDNSEHKKAKGIIRNVVTAMIEEFTGLKPKMHSFLVDGNSEHKKAKGIIKNVVTTLSHNEYKEVLLNNKCLRVKTINKNL